VIDYRLLSFSEFNDLIEDFILLYGKCFTGKTNKNFIKWRYIKNPLKELLVAAAFDDSKLIGIYAASPIIINTEGFSMKMAESLNTMIDPEYSGKGMFKDLANFLYEYMKEKEYFGILGFPNFIANPTFEKKLGWKTISEIPTLEYKIQSKLNLGHSLVDVKLDNDFQFNYSNVDKYKSKFHIKKGREFLAWRYRMNPRDQCNNYVITEKGNNIRSFMIVKKYEDQLNILDYYIDCKDDFEELINSVYKFAIKNSLLRITTWAQFGSNEHYYFQKKRFKNQAPVVYFGANFFKEKYEDLYDYKNWVITMGDCNVY